MSKLKDKGISWLTSAELKNTWKSSAADGFHVGTVDKIEGHGVKLPKKDSGEGTDKDHHHFIPSNLVAKVEG